MQAEIKGTTMPILEVSLDRGEQVISSHGELAWMTQSIQMSQTASTGAGGRGLMQGLKRAVGGGGLLLTRYEGPGAITFAAKVPGHIMPVDINPGMAYFVHRHGWLCGTQGITPSVGLQQSFRGGMWGGLDEALRRPLDAHAVAVRLGRVGQARVGGPDRKSTRLNSSHLGISYAVFCLKK